MARYPLFEALNPNDYRVVGNTAYGAMEGYPFMMTYVNGRTLRASVTVRSIDSAQTKALRGALVQRGIKAAAKGRTVSWQVKTGRNPIPGEVLAPVQTVVSALRYYQIAPPDRCALCGQATPDAYMHYGQCYDAVHTGCVTRLQSNAQNLADENPGSYGRGALGGLIGALVGSIPAILGIAVLHIISAWLFMLIPLATHFGYNKLGGKLDRGAPVISILLSVVGLCFVLLALDVSMNMQWMSMDLFQAIRYTFDNMTIPGYWDWLGSDLARMILFFILGLVFSLSRILRTNKTVVKNLAQMRLTLLTRREGWSAPAPEPAPVSAPAYEAPRAKPAGDDPWAVDGLGSARNIQDKFK